MDENTNTAQKKEREAPKKRLGLPTQIAFLLTVCVLTLLYATGLFGFLGLILMLIAVAMDVLLAFEFENSRGKLILLLFVNIAPFAALTVYSLSVTAALGALYPLFTAFPIWLTIRMKLGRTASITSAAILTMLLWCITFVLVLTEQYGAFNAETVGAVLDGLIEPYIEYISQVAVGEDGAPLIALTTADLELMSYYFKTLLFGTVAAAMIVMAYLATLATRLIANVFGVSWRLPCGVRVGLRAKLTKEGPEVEVFRESVIWRIEMDSVSAGIYVTAYLLTVLFASSSGMLLTLDIVLMNLILMLSPGFFYCGLRDVLLGLRKKSSAGAPGRILFVLALIMIIINPVSVAFILCALGVIVTLRENRARKNAQKIGKE